MSQRDPIFDALWPSIEPHVINVIRGESYRFHQVLGIGRDDAAQEARMFLLGALHKYDYAKSRGGIRKWARTIIHHGFCGMLYAATAQMRAPHVVVTDQDGVERLVRCRVEALDAMEMFEPHDEEGTNPEDDAIESQMSERIRTLRLRLMMSLSGREKDVWECQSQPSEEFLTWVRNNDIDEVTIEVIGQYLALSKNEIDWSLHKVKRLFTMILEESEWADLIEAQVREGSWPMVYMSGIVGDVEFVQAVIQRRELEPRPRAPSDHTSNGQVHRSIEHYAWGHIVQLHLDDERQATLVLEGRFNHRTGEVIGAGGHWKQISDYVPWYGELNRLLSPKRK